MLLTHKAGNRTALLLLLRVKDARLSWERWCYLEALCAAAARDAKYELAKRREEEDSSIAG